LARLDGIKFQPLPARQPNLWQWQWQQLSHRVD